MNNPEKRTVKIDLVKIFLTPPNTKKEKIILFLMLLITFMIFFGPVIFSGISPIKGMLLACMPALSISWGWTVLLRSIFRKKDFCKE